MDHESRDLDGVIDEVAQAMTREEHPRDLRRAIAARLAARQPSWLSVWRVAAASAGGTRRPATIKLLKRKADRERCGGRRPPHDEIENAG
jgi:hypothetical protein